MKSPLIIALFAACAAAAQVDFRVETVKAEASAESPARVDLVLDIAPKWHIYGKTASVGEPTKFEFSLPDGIKSVSLEWQKEKTFESFGEKYGGYDGKATVSALIYPKAGAKAGTEKIKVSAKWLACSDTCVPQEKSAEFEVEIAGGAKAADGGLQNASEIPRLAANAQISKNSPAATPPEDVGKNAGAGENGEPRGARAGFFAVLCAAFAGGLILNLMPCVFPVIGLKIMSFARGAGSSRKSAVLGAAAYAGGIVASFCALAGALIALRAAGENLGWGFQLQNPVFAAAMALLFFAMALSFAGAFEIGAGFAGGSSGTDGRHKYLSSALSGVLAVLVASPCTAPFMGSALGAALAGEASTAESMSVFAMLGLGMASPYVVLAAFPALAKRMPRAGAWTEILKNILSIPLFATVVWLVWLYGKQTGETVHLLSALLVLGVGLRIYGMFSLPHFSRRTRIFAKCAAAAAIAAAMYIGAVGAEFAEENRSGKSAEDAWSAAKVDALRRDGRRVYVDFTAAWCLTCQYNKRVLHSEKIKKLFAERKIAVLVGDWTNRDESITEELKKYGRAGVPLNLLFPPKGRPIELPAVLTESALIEAVDKTE